MPEIDSRKNGKVSPQFQFKSETERNRPLKMVTTRTFSGCICCKKRKIKCDELQPSCSRCTKSSYVCEYKKERQTVKTLKDYKIKKTNSTITRFVYLTQDGIKARSSAKTNKSTIGYTSLKQSNNLDSKEMENKLISTKELSQVKNQTMVSNLQVNEDAMFRIYLQKIGQENASKMNLISNNLFFSSLNMTTDEIRLFDAFVNGFLVAISPQLTHESLLPASIVIPRGLNNEMVRSMFYACGATYMSWQRKELKSCAEMYYVKCLKGIQELTTRGTVAGNEDWLLITMVTFCLREKYQCFDTVRNALFLMASLEIIKYWAKMKKRGFLSQSFTILDDNTGVDIAEQLDTFELDIRMTEICDTLVKRSENLGNCSEDTLSSYRLTTSNDSPINTSDLRLLDTNYSVLEELDNGNTITAFERTMIESFLYNYSVNLLTFDKSTIAYIDSPFQVFNLLKSFLLKPIYKCPVRWMNNPIMGASLPAFELAAKSNWLRLNIPLKPSDREIAMKLQNIAKFYMSPLLPDEVRFSYPKNVQRRLAESCYVGNMVSNASYILLTKILHPDSEAQSPDIQNAVETFFKNLKKISVCSPIGGTCLWAFVITGLVVIDPTSRQYLFDRIKRFSEFKRSPALLGVLNFLESVWEDEDNQNNLWDILLIHSMFKNVFV